MPLVNVLVTGATGFLGSEILRALVDTREFVITALDIKPPSLDVEVFPTVQYLRCNVLDLEELRRVFNEVRPTVVVHTVAAVPRVATRYSGKNNDNIFKVNVEGTNNVIDASKESGVHALVYTSSVTVLFDELEKDFRNADETWSTGKATTAYGQSKAKAESLVLSANTPTFRSCSLRSAPIFGPHDPTTIPVIHGCIANGETPFVLGDGTNLQDYVYVCNVADAHVLAIRNLLSSGSAAGEAFFITNGEPIAVRDLCLAIWKEFDHVPHFEIKIPKGLAWWMGLGAEWLSWSIGAKWTFSRGVILDATKARYASIRKARTILGYEPRVSLPAALKLTCQHFKQQKSYQVRK